MDTNAPEGAKVVRREARVTLFLGLAPREACHHGLQFATHCRGVRLCTESELLFLECGVCR